MIEDLKPLLGKLAIFAKNRFGFEHPPKLFLKQDKENGGCALGKTAHYDPSEKAVTIFVSNRHPKDILRSFTHELVHHCQNLRGDLAPEKMKTLSKNYAQENDHMRKMEEEAYLEGNMCFRDWEDGLEDKLQYKITIAIAEQKFLKENKQMTVKINKKFLKGLITKLLEEREMIKVHDLSTDKQLDKMEAEEKALLAAFGSKEKIQAAVKRHGSAKEALAYHRQQNSTVAQNEGNKTGCDCGECESCEKRLAEESVEEGSMPQAALDALAKKKGESSYSDNLEEEKNEELEEGPMPMINEPEDEDLNGDGKKGSGEVPAFLKNKQEESKIRTPEQEKALYESRFTKKNTRLYEKLLKEWTK